MEEYLLRLKAGLERIDTFGYHSMNEYYTGFDVRSLVDEEAIGAMETTGVVLVFATHPFYNCKST